MLSELAAIDPEAAERSQRNPRRVIRALEVYYETGETITAHNLKTQAIPPRYEALTITLTYEDRAHLYARIDQRPELVVFFAQHFGSYGRTVCFIADLPERVRDFQHDVV